MSEKSEKTAANLPIQSLKEFDRRYFPDRVSQLEVDRLNPKQRGERTAQEIMNGLREKLAGKQ